MGFGKKFWLLVGISGMLLACSGDDSGGGDGSESDGNGEQSGSETPVVSDGFDFGAMYTNLADQVIIPNYLAFKIASASFAADTGPVAQYCAAIGGDQEASALTAVQTAWRDLMGLWQQAELHNIGPAASESSFQRNRIYAFNTRPSDQCRTDRAVVLAQDEAFDISSRDFNSRGLEALEYLLFNGDLNHACSESNPQTETWATLDDTQRKQARCNYSMDLAADIADAADAIHTGWIPEGENFRAAFIGNEDQSVVLKTISDALFYIEKETKDGKLGIPFGFTADCTANACPSSVESSLSNNSLANLQANIDAFADIYFGGTGSSFDDIIVAAEMASINELFQQNIDSISALITTMQTAETNIQTQAQGILDSGDRTDCTNSSANPTTVQTVTGCSLHGLFKQLTDRLRTDFVTVVGVSLPDRVQGDSD